MATLKKDQHGTRSASRTLPTQQDTDPQQYRAFSAHVPPSAGLTSEAATHIPRKAVGGPPNPGQPLRYQQPAQYQRPVTPQSLYPNHAMTPPSHSPGSIHHLSPSSRGLSPSTNRSSPAILLEPPSTGKKKKGLFGGGKLQKSRNEETVPKAWVAGESHNIPYDLLALANSQQVDELWLETGNTYVYLYPESSGRGPSFCVNSSAIAASAILARQVFGGQATSLHALQNDPVATQAAQRRVLPLKRGRQNLSRGSSPNMMPSVGQSLHNLHLSTLDDPHSAQQGAINHLYLPLNLSTDGVRPKAGETEIVLSPDDLELLVEARNLFAFLQGQSLLATPKNPTFFSIFLGISDLLRRYAFSNIDGSTYGGIAHQSFEAYVRELRLGDIRTSVEKTVDMLVLGERMKSVTLYNEAYVHAVGKYDEVLEVRSPNFDLISTVTKKRLEQSSMNLTNRINNANMKLQEFEFPGLFAGLWNSKASENAKHVKFDRWKDCFLATRRFVTSYYSHRYGSWPPKAKPKKNGLEIGGLNRVVLLELYHDLSTVYDLLVDRTSLTTRSQDLAEPDSQSSDALIRALRQVLGEYDRSTPPVQPPIPFDIPIVPQPHPVPSGKPSDVAKAFSKKYKKEDLHKLLQANYNRDAYKETPFLQAFYDFDHKMMEGHSLNYMADARAGQWAFLYAVLQSLPMLVVDAPGIAWTESVEYFLCQPPRSGVPWAIQDQSRKAFSVGGSDKVVYLPSDLIEHGVEGVYRRSHCWRMAQKWMVENPILMAAATETLSDPLPLPPGAVGSSISLADTLVARSRSSSPSNRAVNTNQGLMAPSADSTQIKRRSLVMLENLEALPLPPPVGAGANSRSSSRQHTPQGSPHASPKVRPVSMTADPKLTFDAILGSDSPSLKGKKKW